MPNLLGLAEEQILQEFDSNSSRLIQLEMVSEDLGNLTQHSQAYCACLLARTMQNGLNTKSSLTSLGPFEINFLEGLKLEIMSSKTPFCELPMFHYNLKVKRLLISLLPTN